MILKAPEGYRLQMTGIIELGGPTENSYDNFYIRENDSYSNNFNDPGNYNVSFTSTGRSAGIFLGSSGASADGLDLTVKPVERDDLKSIYGLGAGGQKVTVTGTPDNGYIFNGIEVNRTDGGSVTATGGWHKNNQASFFMPNSDVSVTPIFEEGSYTACIPGNGQDIIDLPQGITLKIINELDSRRWYYATCHGSLILNAPEGYLLRITGKVDNSGHETNDDCFYVYDGEELLAEYWNTYRDNIMLNSTGRSMKLTFNSDETRQNSGVELYVDTIPDDKDIFIEYTSVPGGRINSPSCAKAGNTVTLTAEPSGDLLLAGISVKDAKGNSIPIDREWNSLTASFIMPAFDVTVSAVFKEILTADDLFVNMPKSGTASLEIPAGVSSLKVYDDGGNDGDFSKNCDGSLVLTAPEGCYLELSGRVRTCYAFTNDARDNVPYGWLTAYDGSDDTCRKLLNEVGYTKSDYYMFLDQVNTTRNSLRLYFHSGQRLTAEGLDFTVTVHPVNYWICFHNGSWNYPMTYMKNIVYGEGRFPRMSLQRTAEPLSNGIRRRTAAEPPIRMAWKSPGSPTRGGLL